MDFKAIESFQIQLMNCVFIPAPSQGPWSLSVVSQKYDNDSVQIGLEWEVNVITFCMIGCRKCAILNKQKHTPNSSELELD